MISCHSVTLLRNVLEQHYISHNFLKPIFTKGGEKMASIINFKDICKDFKVPERSTGRFKTLKNFFVRKHKTVHALKNVTFSVEEGDIVGYIGPNGAGKSTTIKIMSGILTPTSGNCEIDGLVPWKNRRQFVKNIGVVFGQRSQLWWDVPIMDSFELLKDIYKIPDEEFKQTLELLNKALNLEELLGRPLRQLSLGQKMKCELAGSLLHRPKILFLDEPTIGLDAITKLAVRDFIKFINKEWHTTIILTTHDMSDIEALTNKIILIGKGQILYQGSFDTIKNKYSSDKTIEVEFARDYDEISLEGYEVVSHTKKFATLKNLPETEFHTKKFVNDISKKYEIVDFQVYSLSVDEILAKLYSEFQL